MNHFRIHSDSHSRRIYEMAYYWLVWIVVFVQLASCAKDEDCLKNYKVDSVKLVVTWPNGYCAAGKAYCGSMLKQDFIIHGLWPGEKHNNSPTKCCHPQKFDIRQLGSLANDLKKHMPTLSGDGDFWSLANYQWNKHGVCARKVEPIKDMVEYFRFMLKQFQLLQIKKSLESYGFSASNNKVVDERRLSSSLEDIYGSEVGIICGKSLKSGKMLLTGLEFCYDTNLELINCKRRQQCQGSLLYLASAH